MARYPGAKWRPIKRAWRYGKMDRHDCAVLHVSASATARSLYGWWNNPQSGDAGSHFHVDIYGVVEQYVDTDYIAWTQRSGSRRGIGIETQGGASGEWTPAQVAAIVKLLIWCCDTHDIPKRDMENSRPSSHGIGTHRYGIDPWRVSGGQVWGGRGKVCPGNDRQNQVPGIIRAVAAGGTTPGGSPAPTREWDEMASKEEVAEVTEAAAWKAFSRAISVGDGETRPLYGMIRDLWYQKDVPADLPRQILTGYDVAVGGATKAAVGVDNVNVAWLLRSAAATLYESRTRDAAHTAAIRELAAAQGVDPDAVVAAIERAVRDALPETITIPLED